MYLLKKSKLFTNSIKRLVRKNNYSYFEALINYEDIHEKSLDLSEIQKSTLKINDKISCPIYGLPYNIEDETQNKDIFSQLKKIIAETEENNIFLQIDPSLMIYHHRLAFQEYGKSLWKGQEQFDIELFKKTLVKPAYLEEACFDNDYFKIYTNEFFQKAEISETLSKQEADHRKSTLLQDDFQKRFIFNNSFTINCEYLSIMAPHFLTETSKKIFFFDIPAVFQRVLIGNTISLQELQEMFKHILSEMKEGGAGEETSISRIFQISQSDVISFSRDIYMGGFIKEFIKKPKNDDLCLILEMPHRFSLQDFFDNPKIIKPNDWKDIFEMPSRIEGETDENLVEKHALLDLLFETELWRQPFVKNPFCYLTDKSEEISEEDQKKLLKFFYVSLKKYEKIKKSVLS